MNNKAILAVIVPIAISVVAMVVYNFAIEPQINKRLGGSDNSQSPQNEREWWNAHLFGK